MTLNVKFNVACERQLEIPVAYASLKDDPTSMRLEKIYNLSKSVNVEPINFLHKNTDANTYLGFEETAYLFQCETIDGKIYHYSLLLQVEDQTVLRPKLQNGRKLFRKKSRPIIKKHGKEYIQRFVNKKS